MKRLTVVELIVNGDPCEVAVEPQATLQEVLRKELGLLGTKESCGMGECGACTVLLDGKPVLSCLTLAVDCEGRSVLTVEGLAPRGEMNPVQRAFLDAGAIQCGFCTPGMVLSTTALLAETPRPDRGQIAKALEGNLCRCTGYNKIVEAVERAAAIQTGRSERHG